eukprot:5102692-Heterocapsa_arctica.AAC.1
MTRQTDNDTTNHNTTTPTPTFDWAWAFMNQVTPSCPHTSPKTNSKAFREGKNEHKCIGSYATSSTPPHHTTRHLRRITPFSTTHHHAPTNNNANTRQTLNASPTSPDIATATPHLNRQAWRHSFAAWK